MAGVLEFTGELTMADRTLFIFGAPLGQWAAAVTALLDARLQGGAVAKWHQEALAVPIPQVDSIDTLDRLTQVGVTPGLVTQLLAQRPAGSPIWGGADVRLVWTAAAVAKALPDAEFLVWVEHPADLLANWLGDMGAADVMAAMTLIESSIHHIATFVHTHKHRCKVMYADDAFRRADALTRHLQGWSVERQGGAAQPMPRALNPLHLLIAKQLVETRPGLMREYERLYACCARVDEKTEPLVDPTRLPRDGLKHLSLLDREAKQGHALATQLEQLRVVNDLAQAQHRQQVQSLEQTQEQLRLDLRRQTQENELMLVHLHQVQEELEHYYLACRDLGAAQGIPAALPGFVRIARVEVVDEHNTPPHRGLNLVLHDVQVADRVVDRLPVRLVEHHGHPGVAFFQTTGEPTPLACWEPTGAENERSFVLLVPTDEQSRRRMQRMGAADWCFTVGVVQTIEHALEDSSSLGATLRWRVVAQRLAKQIADTPARFRFDRIDLDQAAQSADALVLTYGNAVFGSRPLGDIRFHWKPQANRVELLCPNDDGVPLLGCWPVDEAGARLISWSLPLADKPVTDLAQAWQSFSRTEREFLLGFLDALPAAAAVAASSGATAGMGELSQAALRPLRAANRLLHGTRLRRVVRAALGRIPL